MTFRWLTDEAVLFEKYSLIWRQHYPSVADYNHNPVCVRHCETCHSILWMLGNYEH